MKYGCSVAIPLGFLILIVSSMAVAQESARELSTQSLQECQKGRNAQVRKVRLSHFERAQDLAERAVQLNRQLADAHFALFCSLGEKARIDGEYLSVIFDSQRLLTALDRTLELDPTHLDALSSKGTLLVRLPGFLGGDTQKGEQMLRQVVDREPRAINARMNLARVSADRGEYEEAIALAQKALEVALAEHREDLIPEARSTLTEIRALSH